MLKIIGAGFPRTGTTSMKVALEQLGFGPCHHMLEVMRHPEQGERWRTAITGEQVDWEWVLEGYQAAVDWPSAYFWRELLRAAPTAKVVLTIRDPHRWYASFRDTIFRFTHEAARARAAGAGAEASNPMGDVLGHLWVGTFGTQPGEEMPEETRAVELFERHTARVREEVPDDRLLVYETGQGWEPLCDFLGVPVPADTAYPHLNDGDTMRKLAARAREGGPGAFSFDEILTPRG